MNIANKTSGVGIVFFFLPYTADVIYDYDPGHYLQGKYLQQYTYFPKIGSFPSVCLLFWDLGGGGVINAIN